MKSRLIPIFFSLMLFLCLSLAVGYTEYNDLFPALQEATEEQTDPSSPQLLIFEDVHYGTHNKQTFDIALPVDGRKETGIVVYLHGGGWRGGDKAEAYRSFDAFQPNTDYATATVNYRLVKEQATDIYHILDDITLALNQIKTFSASYDVNLTKVVLGGHSAGGHLSLLYCYKYKDISPIEPAGVFAASPVPDLSLDDFYTNNSKGDEKYMCAFMSRVFKRNFTPETRNEFKVLLDEYSPINFVDETSVPTVIIHGENDRVAPFVGSQLLCEKLTEYNVNHELVVFKNTTHSLVGNKEDKKYANRLMLACAKSWFGVKETVAETTAETITEINEK